MKCINCGNELPEASSFCPYCGHNNENAVSHEITEMKAAEKKKSKAPLIILVAVLSVLLLGAVSVFVLDITGVIDISSFFSSEEVSSSEKATDEENEDKEAPEVPSDENNSITVGTGGKEGTYYAFTSASLTTIANDDFKFEVVSSDGSRANILGIDSGVYDMAIVQNDVMNYAYDGANVFDSSVKSFSAVACIYPEICQLVVTEDSGIYSLSDLKGKTVAIGDAGSGVYYNAVQILEAAGLDIERDINTTAASFADAALGLKDGTIDAAFITAGIPTTSVGDLAATTDIRIIDLGEDVINKLIKAYPFYTKYTLTSDPYDFIPYSVNTVALKSCYVVSDDLSEKTVYEITKALWENEAVRTCHAKAEEMDIYTTLDGIGNVPLHPGAEKYYIERGLIKGETASSDFNTIKDGVLTVGTNAAFPPYEYKDGDAFKGIDIELAEVIAEELGLELEIVDVEFGSLIGALELNKFDIVISGITITEDRLKSVDFSSVYARNKQVVVVREGSSIENLDNLKDDGSMTFGVIVDTTGDIYASDTVENGGFGYENVLRFDNYDALASALKNGDVHAIIVDYAIAALITEEDSTLRMLDILWVEEDYGIAVSKDNPKLLKALNNVLSELRSDGTIDDIVNRYISCDASFEPGSYKVNVGDNAKLSLRKQPALDGEFILAIPNGTLLEITEIRAVEDYDGNRLYWGNTSYIGHNAWVCMDYLVSTDS